MTDRMLGEVWRNMVTGRSWFGDTKAPMADTKSQDKKLETHVMLDLETMSTEKNAATVVIGAVRFNRNETLDTFKAVVDLRSSVAAGLVMDADTVLWWMEKSEAARQELLETAVPLEWALDKFARWIRYKEKVWGNGSDFDNVILESSYKAIGKPLPWNHFNHRCYRTVSNEFPCVPFTRQGTHHSAVDDAMSQAMHLIRCWNWQDTASQEERSANTSLLERAS